jgi:hypothetical protein
VKDALVSGGGSAFVQWKNTDVCCDFTCSCGHVAHLDAQFMYYVRCGSCGVVWESPSYISFKQAELKDVRLVDQACVILAVDDGH